MTIYESKKVSGESFEQKKVVKKVCCLQKSWHCSVTAFSINRKGSTYCVVICDSQRGFAFSRLKSFLWRRFSRQDKKIEIIRIINGSVTFKQYESYLNTLNTGQLWLFSIFYFNSLHIFHNRAQLLLKKFILESPKNMIKLPLIWLMYYSTLKVNFQTVLIKSNFCVPLLTFAYKFITKPLLETNIFKEMVTCVAIDFKSDTRQRKAYAFISLQGKKIWHSNVSWK